MSQREPIGIISHGTLGRTRRVGSDRNGLPIEEQVPALAGIIMYDRDGGRVHCPTSCHRVTLKTTAAEHYKSGILKQLLIEGFLREDRCPHTAVEALGDRPPVMPPEGFAGCKEHSTGDVAPFDRVKILGGCVHLREIVQRRRNLCTASAAARKNKAAEATQLQLAKRLAEESTKVVETSAEGAAALKASRTSRRDRTVNPIPDED